MIDYISIRQGIRALLSAVSDPNMPVEANIAWENRAYKPVSDTPYIRETMIPGTERKVASDEIEVVGITQFDLIWPLGSGTEDIDALGFAIQNAFKPETKITDHAAVYRTERLTSIQDPKWYMLPIRLTWRAFAFSDLGCGVAPVAVGNILDEFGALVLDEVGAAVLEDA